MPSEVVRLTSADILILRTLSITAIAGGTQVECQYPNCTNHRGRPVIIAIHERCLDVASLIPCPVGSVNEERLKWFLGRLWILCSCKHHRFQEVLDCAEKLKRLTCLDLDIQGEEEVMFNATPSCSRKKHVRGHEDISVDEVSSKKPKILATTPEIISEERLEDPFTTPIHKDKGKAKAPFIMTPTPAAPSKHMGRAPINLVTTTATPTPEDPSPASCRSSSIVCSCCAGVFSPAVEGEHFLSWCMSCRALWEASVQLGMVVDPLAVKQCGEEKKPENAVGFNNDHVNEPLSVQSGNITYNNFDFSTQDDQAEGVSNAKHAALPVLSSGFGFDSGDNDPLGFNFSNNNIVNGDPCSFSGWNTAGSLLPSSALGFGGMGAFGFNSAFGNFDSGVDDMNALGFNKNGDNTAGAMLSGNLGSNIGDGTAFGFGNNDRTEESSSQNTSALSKFPSSKTSRSGSGGVNALDLDLSSHNNGQSKESNSDHTALISGDSNLSSLSNDNVGNGHTKKSSSTNTALIGIDDADSSHFTNNNGQTQDTDSNNVVSTTYEFNFDVSGEQTDIHSSQSDSSGESSIEQISSRPVHVNNTGIALTSFNINNDLSNADATDHTSSYSSTSDQGAAEEFDFDFHHGNLIKFYPINTNMPADNLADPSHEGADHEGECPA